MVKYQFYLDAGQILSFDIDIDRNNVPREPKDVREAWVRLDNCRCENCTLSPEKYLWCPAAVDIEHIIARFCDIISCHQMVVHVTTAQRTFVQRCDAQTAINSLLGVVLASSACPILSQLHALAHFHLPFATVDETIYRTVGNYLLKQYFVNQLGQKPDLELKGLSELYANLEIVNTSLARRIDTVSKRDANINAIVQFFAMSSLVRSSIEERLIPLAAYF